MGKAKGNMPAKWVQMQRVKLGIWIRLALIAIALVFGTLGLYREKAASPKPSPVPPTAWAVTRAEINIEGMDCMMCAAGLQNKLRTLHGVSQAEVSFQEKRAAIAFDPGVISRARLVEAIEADGFKVATKDTAPRIARQPSQSR